MAVLLLVPEIVLVIDSVKLQPNSFKLPSRVMGERVLLAVVVRMERAEEEDWEAEEED